MARLEIILTNDGIQEVTSRVRNVADSDENAKLRARVAVILSLLHRVARSNDTNSLAVDSPVPDLNIKS